MPEISRFYGIVIFMNYSDHEPAHFHARYQEQEVIVEIETGIVQVKMSKRALRMTLEGMKNIRMNWRKIGIERKDGNHCKKFHRCSNRGEEYVFTHSHSHLPFGLYSASGV